jgi:predicted metalloprotease
MACGSDDDPQLAPTSTTKQEKLQQASTRIEAQLDQAEQEIPDANRQTQRIRTDADAPARTMDEFLTAVIRSIDRYWTETLTAAGAPEPFVSYVWLAPGERVQSACTGPGGTPEVADDSSAFYCPADDTIYVAQRFAAELWDGIRSDLPGATAGYGRAIGDFGVAYVVAHEYGHNIQQELGFREARPIAVKQFELQADCMAGLWGNSVYYQGLLDPGDVEEAMSTALAVGDFDLQGEQHHGTPEERQQAWSLGFGVGDPSVCNRFLEIG